MKNTRTKNNKKKTEILYNNLKRREKKESGKKFIRNYVKLLFLFFARQALMSNYASKTNASKYIFTKKRTMYKHNQTTSYIFIYIFTYIC